MEKSYRKCITKALPILTSVNEPKQPLHARNFETRYFERGLSKTVKKENFIFSFEPSRSYWARLWKFKRSLELVTSRSPGYKTSSESSFLVMCYLIKFDDVIYNGFWVFQKLHC